MRLAAIVRCSLVSLTLVVGLLAVTPGTASAAIPVPPASRPQPGCGTWVLQEVSSRAQLRRQAPAIKAALRKRGVRGLSIRVPWSSIDRNFKLLNKARKIANSQDKALAVRFLAGRSTPARVFREGAYYYTANGERIPKPFSDSGRGGNPVFQRNYKAVVMKLAAWAERKKVRMLHLPWYGYRWAEIYNGSAVRAARGYSERAWLKGHLKLVRIGHRVSSRRLTVEFALSGDWGSNGSAAGAIADRIIDRTGPWSRRAVVQGNGLGRWNSPSTNRKVFHAKQMVDGGDYDWASIYQTLRSNHEAYAEVYLSSFSGPRARQLAVEARQFKRDRC